MSAQKTPCPLAVLRGIDPSQESEHTLDEITAAIGDVAQLAKASLELVRAQADYDRLDAPGGAKWDRLQAARFAHAEVTAKFNGATK